MSNKILGAIFLIASTAIYGLFGIFSRQTAVFGSFSQGWIRYLFVVFIIGSLFLTRRARWKNIDPPDTKWFLTWILPASFQPVLTFMAFTHLPIGIAYFLIYSTMITGGILSGKLFFAEKFNLGKLLSLLLIFLGLILIYRSDLSLITNTYVFLALVSGLIVGFWNTLSKKVSHKYSELQMMLLDSLSTLTVSLIGFFSVREALPDFSNLVPWYWIVAFAFAGVLSSFLLIRGFKYVEAQIGSLILPMELVFASLFGYFFLGEVLKPNVYLGGLLIFLAAIIPVLGLSANKTDPGPNL